MIRLQHPSDLLNAWSSLRVMLFGLGLSSLATLAMAAESDHQHIYDVKVAQDYIDVRTGPGRGYPIFQILEQGELLRFVRQKTNWIFIESEQGVQGWLPSAALPSLKSSAGKPFIAGVMDVEPLTDYFEFGLGAGDFGGSQLLTGHLSYAFTQHITLEAILSEAIGTLSTTHLVGGQLIHLVKPWKGLRPYGGLGAGLVFVKASARISQPEDQQDDYLKAVVGVRAHIDGRFYMKFEYGSYLVLRSQDDNDEINEWKLGISTLF